MRMQVGRVMAAVVVVGAVVSGCGGPNQAGSAVIVGADSVPLEHVQSQLSSVLGRSDLVSQVTSQGGGPDDIARDIVTNAVLHDLLQRQAVAEGIQVTDEDVDGLIAQQGGAQALLATSFTDEAGLRDRVRDELIASKLAEKSVAGLTVTADLVAATSRTDAAQKAQTLAEDGPAAKQLLAGDSQTAAPDMTYTAAGNPDAAGTVLFGTPVGGVVYFQPDPQQSTWIVFRITDRSTNGPSDPAALSQISQDQLVTIGERMLQPVATQLGVNVNPRYGVWDPIRLRVVPADLTAGMILPPTAS